MQKILDDLPWWLKGPLIFGGGLMSAFSSQLPDGLQVAGLYTGIALSVLGESPSFGTWSI
jgi:hypothetical protein